jgi:hypothetical protein
MKLGNLTFALFVAAFGIACGEDEEPINDNPNGQSLPIIPRITVMSSALTPFASTNGDFAFASDTVGIGATTRGITAISLDGDTPGLPPTGYSEWSLTSSTGFGPASGSFAVTPPDRFNGAELAFFNPAGQPQIGALQLRTDTGQGSLLTEAALDAPLSSGFPSAMVAGNDGLWVVDSVFGPGSSVRHYGYDSFSALNSQISESPGRAFVPEIGDVNNDGIEDFASLGKMVTAEDGSVGLVAFSFLAPAPQGAAGGVLAFDTNTGRELGRALLPLTASSSTALEFVGGIGTSGNYLALSSSQKSSSFADLGGKVALYKVDSWSPFRVVDADENAPFDQPESSVTTSKPNPVGLSMRGNIAVVINAPFMQDGSIDLISMRKMAQVDRTAELGALYTDGFSTPGDPKISRDRSTAYIPSEAGLIRVGFSN